MATARRITKKLVVCVRNSGFRASLERGKLYRFLPDPDAAKHGQLCVIDESGEDYIYPAEYFIVRARHRRAIANQQQESCTLTKGTTLHGYAINPRNH